MRYKAMAKKLRQLVELDDPIPAEVVLANEEDLQKVGADENINESADKRTTKCVNENTNASCNSLQNTDSNSTNNKNAITMRNKFALVENYRGESGELSNGRARDGGEDRDLSHKGENSGELSENIFVNNRLTIEDRKRVSIIKAIGIYKEVTEGVDGVTQLMARIDAFLNPERIEEATTLAMWREKYESQFLPLCGKGGQIPSTFLNSSKLF